MRSSLKLLIAIICLQLVSHANAQHSSSANPPPDRIPFHPTASPAELPQVSVKPIPKPDPHLTSNRFPSFQTHLEPLQSSPDAYRLQLTVSENIREIVLSPEYGDGKSIRVSIDYLNQMLTDGGVNESSTDRNSLRANQNRPQNLPSPENTKSPPSYEYDDGIAANVSTRRANASTNRLSVNSPKHPNFQRNPFYTSANENFPAAVEPFQQRPDLTKSVQVPSDSVNPIYLTVTEGDLEFFPAFPQIQQQLWEMPAASEIRDTLSKLNSPPDSGPIRIRFSD